MSKTDGRDEHGAVPFGMVGYLRDNVEDPDHWKINFCGTAKLLNCPAVLIQKTDAEHANFNQYSAEFLEIYLPEFDLGNWKTVGNHHLGQCKTVWYYDGKLSLTEDMARKQMEPKETNRVNGWNATDPLPLLGATIITPGYEALGEEAVKRFQQHTGLPCNVLRFSGDSGFAYKLALPDLLPPVPVVFFDADLWLLRKTDFGPQIAKGAVSAVPDPGTRDANSFVSLDCEKLGLERRQYFNSGLFIADFSCEHVRAAFRRAAKILEDKTTHEITDYGDQTALNMAIQRSGVPFHPMPAGFNFFMHAVSHGYGSVPDLVYGLHAAGVKKADKLAHLKSLASVFGFEDRSSKKTPPTVNPVIVYPTDDEITNVFEANNDASLPIAYRTERALRWLRERPPHLIKGEALAALKCFLTYRVIDGLIPLKTWNDEIRDIEPTVKELGLSVRWEISQRTAEVYLMTFFNPLEDGGAVRLLNRSQELKASAEWPACICNLIRVATLAAYRAFLNKDLVECGLIIDHAMRNWQTTMSLISWETKPMRFAEMREDREAILMLMVIAKAIGLTTFKEHDWLHIPQMASGKGPFHRAVRALNQLNPERALWK